jgi:hypothetical protein
MTIGILRTTLAEQVVAALQTDNLARVALGDCHALCP